MFHFHIHNSHIYQREPVFGKKFQAALIIGGSQLKFILILTRRSPKLISRRVIRIPFETKIGIFFGALEIVEHKFCHRAKIIRFGKIGFRADHLIKILYGKHIIFEVERIFPDHHHTIGIHLRRNRKRGQKQTERYDYFFHLCLDILFCRI